MSGGPEDFWAVKKGARLREEGTALEREGDRTREKGTGPERRTGARKIMHDRSR